MEKLRLYELDASISLRCPSLSTLNPTSPFKIRFRSLPTSSARQPSLKRAFGAFHKNDVMSLLVASKVASI